METLDLQEIRGKLDEIDARITELFEERMKLCQDVAEFKLGTGKPVYDAQREQEKLKALTAQAHGEFNKKGIFELFSQIMTISRRMQYALLARHGKVLDTGFTMVEELKKDGVRVAYQGVEGSYGHGAALKYFGKGADLYHVAAMEDAMTEVEEGRADYGVLPIENSSAGAVSDNYDLLVKHNVYIVGEIQLPVNHALLGLPDASLEDIKEVYSHPQALMQCSNYLNSHREWRQVSMVNTAVAAKKVLEDKDPAQAAIASRYAAEHYGLEILKEGITSSSSNATRFIIVSKKKMFLKGAGKVSICFELPHERGSLYNILSHVIYNNLNMTKIESRPIPEKNWEYRFFVDFEGNLGDSGVKNALRGIEQEARRLRIFGNY